MAYKSKLRKYKLWFSFGDTSDGVQEHMKASFHGQKPVERIITEHFLNIFDYENFFPKEHLLTSLRTLVFISRNTVWDMMF